MAPITFVCGLLLIAVGVVGYLMQDPEKSSWTALIPAFIGVVFIVMSYLASKEHLRKHAMHLAAALGLVGVIAGLGRLIQSAVKGTLTLSLASVCISLMTIICAVFVGLCVNSFIQARRRRAQNTTGQE